MPHPKSQIFARLSLWLFLGCASAPDQASPESQPYDPAWKTPTEEVSIGKLLAECDSSLRAWTHLVMTASSNEDRTKARGLELDLSRRLRPRQAEVVAELESGPTRNRTIAAAVLGFTRDVTVQNPLLNALHDPEADVVHNALIGLAVLQRADTPLGPICELLRDHVDGHVRSNAAYALREILSVGAVDACATESARLALADSEPFVRAQACLILARTNDSGSLSNMADLALDELPFVATAACESIAALGLSDPHSKGIAARALARAYAKADKKLRGRVQRSLIRLSEQNLGDDPAAWSEWAVKLP